MMDTTEGWQCVYWLCLLLVFGWFGMHPVQTQKTVDMLTAPIVYITCEADDLMGVTDKPKACIQKPIENKRSFRETSPCNIVHD